MISLAQVALPAPVTNTTGVDMNQIIGASGGNPLMVLALGAIAILGGKKIWDFWQKKQELAHEQKMEELKISKTGHEACVEKQKSLEENLTTLKSKVSEIEAKSVESEKKVAEVVSTSEEKVEELRSKVSKLKKKILVEEKGKKKEPK